MPRNRFASAVSPAAQFNAQAPCYKESERRYEYPALEAVDKATYLPNTTSSAQQAAFADTPQCIESNQDLRRFQLAVLLCDARTIMV